MSRVSHVCRVSHVTEHMTVTCHVLLGYSKVCTTRTTTINIFFLQVQLLPKPFQEQLPTEVFRSALSVAVPMGHTTLWWCSLFGNEQTTDSLSLLLQKRHQLKAQTLRLFKSNILKTVNMVRSKRQEAVKHWRWPSPPLGSSCWNSGWGTAMIKKQHCCCPSCKVVNPWQKTQPNPRAWSQNLGLH